MGCCENLNNLTSNNNKDLSKSLYLNEIKKESSIKNEDINIFLEDDKTKKSVPKNQSISKLQMEINNFYKMLYTINEVESEYKESQINSKLFSKEKITPKDKISKYKKISNEKTNKEIPYKIRNKRKNTSVPEFKKVLSDDIFNKKLNEYTNINKNYDLNLNKRNFICLKKDKQFWKTMRHLRLKDGKFAFMFGSLNKKRANRNINFKFFNDSITNQNNEKDFLINKIDLSNIKRKSNIFK